MIPSSSRIEYNLRYNFGSTVDLVAPFASNGVSLGNWVHLAGVFEPTGNAMKLYINGNLAGLTSLPAPMRSQIPPEFYVSGSPFGTEPGTLDEVLLYNRALSATEIHNILVPEPATLLLLAAGAVPLLRRLRPSSRKH